MLLKVDRFNVNRGAEAKLVNIKEGDIDISDRIVTVEALKR